MARRGFPCAHQGKGQYCHRCRQEAEHTSRRAQDSASQLAQRQAERLAWEATFVADPIEPAAEPGNFDDHGADIIQEPRPVVTPPAPQPIIYTFDLRHLDPTSEISGLQGRLRHLGYPVGPADGTLDPRSVEALRAFQTEQGLEVTGSSRTCASTRPSSTAASPSTTAPFAASPGPARS